MPKIDLKLSKGIFVASVAASFILLFIESRKTARVIKSRDIAYGYTCIGAYRYYTVKSYAYFCFYGEIEKGRVFKEVVAFFCFFVLKGRVAL